MNLLFVKVNRVKKLIAFRFNLLLSNFRNTKRFDIRMGDYCSCIYEYTFLKFEDSKTAKTSEPS
jgi:hypothetical protein